ncbi:MULTISPECIES: response regulator transcription factor [unclassified Oceanispirochaeta]|uniref:response regulator transcription factor n=1 Tax=unclassified Oceanispirochaeta TaxID=2635722 RepID=UPI000E09368A|nr:MULTISPECIES: response regulator transcription factor [unclassified Oceanispirochaeta]MBF9018588.1 response regulator transcription factor [Oceanispirochaeta sp. M2]NPD75005.1 response regulator transcription factor [Oceanispirochaeta sp. M1]RDG29126.1 DNA-binding response regulator [Oceanispirochaeta sp. M1]
MKASVLVVEDEKDIAELIKLYLEKEGIDVLLAADGEMGLEFIRGSLDVDLVVLDLNLPGLDGFEFLQILRKDLDIPVVIVSARHEDGDMIMGFGIGADDFVAKPFSPRVLAARVRAHLRRRNSEKSEPDTNIIHFGKCVLDKKALSLFKEGQRVSLSPREIQVLIYLAEEPGSPRSQQDIYDAVWGQDFGDLNTVSVHIQRLRQKLEDEPSNPCYIKNVYGFGYTLISAAGEES